MNSVLRRRLEMAVRTRDLLRAHRTEVAGEATALARLDELVQRAETLTAQQRAGDGGVEQRPQRAGALQVPERAGRG